MPVRETYRVRGLRDLLRRFDPAAERAAVCLICSVRLGRTVSSALSAALPAPRPAETPRPVQLPAQRPAQVPAQLPAQLPAR